MICAVSRGAARFALLNIVALTSNSFASVGGRLKQTNLSSDVSGRLEDRTSMQESSSEPVFHWISFELVSQSGFHYFNAPSLWAW
jgi:hypothetical protein